MHNENTAVDVNSLVKEIKQSFRLFMNGVASQSMRDKGLAYKINWGIPLPRLRDMASRYEPSAALAIALWQSDVRECKLLAMMLMPADACDETTAKQWMADCANQEMAEMLAFHLLQSCHSQHNWLQHCCPQLKVFSCCASFSFFHDWLSKALWPMKRWYTACRIR